MLIRAYYFFLKHWLLISCSIKVTDFIMVHKILQNLAICYLMFYHSPFSPWSPCCFCNMPASSCLKASGLVQACSLTSFMSFMHHFSEAFFVIYFILFTYFFLLYFSHSTYHFLTCIYLVYELFLASNSH